MTGQKRKAGNDQDDVDPGKDIIDDLIRAFRSWVEGREWLHMRLTVSCLMPRRLQDSQV